MGGISFPLSELLQRDNQYFIRLVLVVGEEGRDPSGDTAGEVRGASPPTTEAAPSVSIIGFLPDVAAVKDPAIDCLS